MATKTDKPTEADLMTGFNPAFAVSAEEIEAQEADAEAIDGDKPEGAGETSPETSTEPASTAGEREVTLDGRTYKAPKDIADAFTREINRRDGTRGAELQTLRERLANLEGRLTAKPAEAEGADQGPPIPDPELQIEDPKKHQDMAFARMRWEQEQLVESKARQFEEGQAAKDQESQRVAAWNRHVDSFYAKPENAVLRENRDVVDMVLKQHGEELAPLSVEDGFKRLGDLAKDRIARMTGQAPEVRARRTPKPAVLEGSSRRGDVVTPVKKDEGPRSLTSAINERRAKAREAFNKGGQPRVAASR